MIGGVIPYVPYSHHFEEAPVCPQDVVTSCPHQYAFSHLIPRLHFQELPVIPEVVEEYHQPELHQQIIDLLTAGDMGLDDIGVEVP